MKRIVFLDTINAKSLKIEDFISVLRENFEVSYNVPYEKTSIDDLVIIDVENNNVKEVISFCKSTIILINNKKRKVTEFLIEKYGIGILSRIRQLGNRFWYLTLKIKEESWVIKARTIELEGKNKIEIVKAAEKIRNYKNINDNRKKKIGLLLQDDKNIELLQSCIYFFNKSIRDSRTTLHVYSKKRLEIEENNATIFEEKTNAKRIVTILELLGFYIEKIDKSKKNIKNLTLIEDGIDDLSSVDYLFVIGERLDEYFIYKPFSIILKNINNTNYKEKEALSLPEYYFVLDMKTIYDINKEKTLNLNKKNVRRIIGL